MTDTDPLVHYTSPLQFKTLILFSDPKSDSASFFVPCLRYLCSKQKINTGFILHQAYKKLSLFMTILEKKNYDFFMTSATFLCRGLMFSNDVTH